MSPHSLRLGCLAAALVFAAAAGCGGDESGYVTTPEALAAFRAAGFQGVKVLSNREAVTRLRAGIDPNDALDSDTMLVGTSGYPFVPLVAARVPSSDLARETVAGNGDAGIDHLRELGLVPRDFDRDRWRVERVCNVALSSYDDGSDPELGQRLERALDGLRDRC